MMIEANVRKNCIQNFYLKSEKYIHNLIIYEKWYSVHNSRKLFKHLFYLIWIRWQAVRYNGIVDYHGRYIYCWRKCCGCSLDIIIVFCCKIFLSLAQWSFVLMPSMTIYMESNSMAWGIIPIRWIKGIYCRRISIWYCWHVLRNLHFLKIKINPMISFES